MKMQVEIRSFAEIDINLKEYKSIDEVEKAIKDHLTWRTTAMEIRSIMNKAEVYLAIADRGDVLTELEKNNP